MVAVISKDNRSLPDVHRFSIVEYHALGKKGVLAPDSRTELINGAIFDMSPIGTRHASVVDCLNEWFSGQRQGYRVRVQNPVTLGDDSEPQPDLAILTQGDYSLRHPAPEDIYLIVEVADSSTKFDAGIKAQLYATHGVREYWLVDLTQEALVVHQQPGTEGYRLVLRPLRNESIAPGAFPDVQILVAALFGASSDCSGGINNT